MAIQTDPTLTGLQAYVEAEYADAYLGFSRLHASAWPATVLGDKEKALVWASRLLNGFNFRGLRTDANQTLDWPRDGVPKEGSGFSQLYDSDEIPTCLKDATCELALHLLASDRTLLHEENLGLSNLGVGSISLTFDHTRKENTIPKYIRDMLLPIINIGKIIRG